MPLAGLFSLFGGARGRLVLPLELTSPHVTGDRPENGEARIGGEIENHERAFVDLPLITRHPPFQAFVNSAKSPSSTFAF
jgi:hypothetical protein